MTDTNPLHVPPANPRDDGLGHDDASACAAHEEIATRAASAGNYAHMTRFSRGMSREEIVAKFMGIPIEDAPAALAAADATPSQG
jgi:hypothetical protein